MVVEVLAAQTPQPDEVVYCVAREPESVVYSAIAAIVFLVLLFAWMIIAAYRDRT